MMKALHRFRHLHPNSASNPHAFFKPLLYPLYLRSEYDIVIKKDVIIFDQMSYDYDILIISFLFLQSSCILSLDAGNILLPPPSDSVLTPHRTDTLSALR